MRAGRERALALRVIAPGCYSWLEGTRVVHAEVEGTASRIGVALRGWALSTVVTDARPAAASAVVRAPVTTGPVIVKAPLSGRLTKVLVKAGDVVTSGQGLVIVEAMKMENEIRSPRAGTVRELRCAEGEAVEAHQPLLTLE